MSNQPQSSSLDASLLRAILQLSALPVLLLDKHFCLLEISPGARPYFPGVEVGASFASIWGPELAAAFQSTVDELGQLGEIRALHSSHAQVNGVTSHLQWKVQALRRAPDEAWVTCWVGEDRTHQDRLEQELKRSLLMIRDQKKALDESSIVAITDHRGVIQYVNDTFCRISGYSEDELIGRTHAVLKSDHHPPEFFRDLWRTIATGRVWKGEIKNRSKDGDYYWVDTTIVPFVNENGRPYQYIAIRNDITEKKAIQENLERERMRTMHAEKMASLGELAAGIAHELGNPTASINAWLDVIESQYERDKLNMEVFLQTLPKVRRDAKRIRDIIRGMLAYARDGSRDPFQSESPQTIVQQVVDYCSYKIRKVGVQVTIEVPNPYITLECRVTEVSQILVNFILNACDAVQELPERWIKIRVLEREDWIDFEITDSGHGIPKAIADKIYNPFFTTKPIGRGTGLGLSIAKSIIDNHRGHITLDHSASHTRFLVSLPKRHAEDP